jgi:acyl carrier protein
MKENEAEIRKFIAEKFFFQEEPQILAEESFFESGIMDSMGVLELIAFLESRFGIQVSDDELVPANLDSIANVCRFLERK